MKTFRVYRTDYTGKIPKIKYMYAGYKGLKRGVQLMWNGKLIPLVLPINERRENR